MIEPRAGAEYAIGLRMEKQIYVDHILVDSYIRSLNVLRPQRAGRIGPWTFHSTIGDFRRWEIAGQVGRTYDTRAQAAQTANENFIDSWNRMIRNPEL